MGWVKDKGGSAVQKFKEGGKVKKDSAKGTMRSIAKSIAEKKGKAAGKAKAKERGAETKKSPSKEKLKGMKESYEKWMSGKERDFGRDSKPKLLKKRK